jgi:porphobilinogen synthase
MSKPTTLHSAFHHPTLRAWSASASKLSKDSLIYPVFVTDAPSSSPIPTLPNIAKHSLADFIPHLTPLVEKGLQSILIFGVPSTLERDNRGSIATSELNPAIVACRMVREKFGNQLLVCVDVCLCAFTDHGHCGILDDEGNLDNEKSIARIAECKPSLPFNEL